jgi:hypothetical protein
MFFINTSILSHYKQIGNEYLVVIKILPNFNFLLS